MKLTKQLIACLIEKDVKQTEDGMFLFTIATSTGLVSMMIRVDEELNVLYFDSTTALKIPDVKLDDCYNLANRLNQRFEILKIIIYPEDMYLGCSVAWLNIDKLDIKELDEYIGLSSEGLSHVLPAFITLIRSKLTIDDALDILDMEVGEA